MSFFQNTCKPVGFGGKIMVAMMNSGHAALADWGFSQITLSADASVLDVGCGGGANIRTLLKLCPDGHITGADYSAVSVEKSRRVNKKAVLAGRCDVVEGSADDLPFADGAFDAVTAFETVYFWPGLTKCFREVHRVLKNGGRFLICNESDGKKAEDEKWTKIIGGMTIYTAEQLEEALKQAGFGRITTRKNDRGWVCVTAEK